MFICTYLWVWAIAKEAYKRSKNLNFKFKEAERPEMKEQSGVSA